MTSKQFLGLGIMLTVIGFTWITYLPTNSELFAFYLIMSILMAIGGCIMIISHFDDK